jgi:transposase
MRGEVLGRVERRRRWSTGEKLAVVMASLEPDAVVATVARRFDVTRQQVYDWRRAARRGDLGTPGGVVGFVEVVAETPAHGAAIEVEAAPIARARESATAVGAAAAPAMTVEIVLVGGRVLRAPAALPTAELRRLIGAVEGA